MLDVQKVTVDFVGVRALDNASFQVDNNQIVGLIGPNGAGKTTLFNVISGFVTPTQGAVFFDGQDIAKFGPAKRNLMGLARTFQVVKPFGGLSVLDNVIVGALTNGQSLNEARNTAFSILDRLGMKRFAHTLASSLPLALRKYLEVGRALATSPKLLLLDEIVGGLNPKEVEDTLALIKELQQEGYTLLLIEHNMHAVMRISEKIVVLEQGRVLTEGPPEVVTRDEKVIAVYLGEQVEYS